MLMHEAHLNPYFRLETKNTHFTSYRFEFWFTALSSFTLYKFKVQFRQVSTRFIHDLYPNKIFFSDVTQIRFFTTV